MKTKVFMVGLLTLIVAGSNIYAANAGTLFYAAKFDARIFTAPNPQSEYLEDSLPKGETVEYLSITGDYINVRRRDGSTGWIHWMALERTETEQKQTGYIYEVITPDRFYEEPTVNSRVIEDLKVGRGLEYIKAQDDMMQVKDVTGVIGWVKISSLSIKETPPPKVNKDSGNYHVTLRDPPKAPKQPREFRVERFWQSSSFTWSAVLATPRSAKIKCVLYDSSGKPMNVDRKYVAPPYEEVTFITGDQTSSISTIECFLQD